MRPAADPPIVLNHLGRDAANRIVAAVPGTRVMDVPPDGSVPDDVEGEVLLTLPWGTPNLGDRGGGAGVRWVHSLSTGVDKFPIDALPADVTLSCSRGASAVPIAEFVLAAMLAFEKQLPDVWVHEPPKHWSMADLGGLEGRMLGLIGAGGIATEVARRALAFGMRVCFVRRTDAPAPLAGMQRCGLAEVLAAADHLVVAAPSTPTTQHLLGAEALAGVKPGVHVVNVSRGSLIDQVALVEALDDGRVAEGHARRRRPRAAAERPPALRSSARAAQPPRLVVGTRSARPAPGQVHRQPALVRRGASPWPASSTRVAGY